MSNDRNRRHEDEREADGTQPRPDEQQAGAPQNDAEGEPSAEELLAEAEASLREDLEARIAELEEQRLRLAAEVENTRRQKQREVEDAGRYAITRFAREMLDIEDNLGRALDAVPSDAAEANEAVAALVEGVAMTRRGLQGTFERHQIHKVEPAIGERFDHKLHQAMFEAESAEQPPGTITNVMQCGYTIADRLLRPALVGVAKAPSQPQAPDGGEHAEPEGEQGGQPGRRIDTTA